MTSFADIVPDPAPTKLLGGLQFTEGPVWRPEGYLLFSDIPANRVVKYTPDGGAAETHLSPSGNSNGLTFDREGRLMACEHGGRRVSRQGADGRMETVASSWNGKRLNSPNDLVVHSSGAVFFTDPPYGISPEQAEIGFNGVYRIDPDGAVTLLANEFGLPNGIAFSPDESILYVDDTERRNVPHVRRERRPFAVRRPRSDRHGHGRGGKPGRDEGGYARQSVRDRRGRRVGGERGGRAAGRHRLP